MRLLHTMIRVGNLERSIAFYQDVLGMKLLRKNDYPKGEFTLAFMGYGDERSHSVIELTYNWGRQDYTLGDAFGHFAIEVDDVSEAFKEMVVKGAKSLREPAAMNAGKTQIAFIADPDGYPIELIGRKESQAGTFEAV
ncbi:lactoylglutathione lyase [Magnetococcales bacterium HHB-1]